MAGIKSFTPPHGADSDLDKLTECTIRKNQLQSKEEGIDYDDIESKNSGGDNNDAA